ncbi:hypothetical protein LTR86_005677 [Recurvomyces mirabilis]|nr:hypothetical protein LTR86_005677 [Recurvomyces mirabilis]
MPRLATILDELAATTFLSFNVEREYGKFISSQKSTQGRGTGLLRKATDHRSHRIEHRDPFKISPMKHRLRRSRYIDEHEVQILLNAVYKPRGRDRLPTARHQVHHDEAYDQLHHVLQQPLDGAESTAHRRLSIAWSQANGFRRAQFDLPFKIFDDLDFLLFDNQLRRRVHLSWFDLGRGHLLGQTIFDSSTPRISINLNQIELLDAIDGMDVPLTWGALVHEMLLAWAFVMINPGERRAGHGREFECAAAALTKKLGLRGLDVEDVVD